MDSPFQLIIHYKIKNEDNTQALETLHNFIIQGNLSKPIIIYLTEDSIHSQRMKNVLIHADFILNKQFNSKTLNDVLGQACEKV